MGRERPWLHREAAPFLSERAKCSKRQLTLFFFFFSCSTFQPKTAQDFECVLEQL